MQSPSGSVSAKPASVRLTDWQVVMQSNLLRAAEIKCGKPDRMPAPIEMLSPRQPGFCVAQELWSTFHSCGGSDGRWRCPRFHPCGTIMGPALVSSEHEIDKI